MIPTLPVGPSVDDRIHQARYALRLSGAVDFQVRQVERVEPHLDFVTRQMGRRFEETMAQQERGIAAYQTIDTMEEQATHIGGRRQLPYLGDVFLPAQ